jgi:hypothetical protein
MASLQDRVIGALKLQPATFEEVENDAAATSQAATVVGLAAVSGGLASLVWGFSPAGFIIHIVLAFLGWAIASVVVWFLGTRVFPGKRTEADLGQLLRVLGFAQSPGLFSFVNLVPILGWLAGLLLSVWSLIALVIGVRQALDYDDTLRAVLVCVVAWAIMIAVFLIGAALGFSSLTMMRGGF